MVKKIFIHTFIISMVAIVFSSVIFLGCAEPNLLPVTFKSSSTFR